MSRDRTTSFPSWAWTAALILALTAGACSKWSTPVTSAKPAPPAPTPPPAAAPAPAPAKPPAAPTTQAPPPQAPSTTQAPPTKPPAPTAPAAPTKPAAPAGSAQKSGKLFTEDDLAAILAPIALYPDTVVAQILMASTYPIEVIEANRWVQQNKQLKGDELAAAAQKKEWEDSVTSLVAAPEVLKQLDENLAWMQKLGDAFLSQQEDVFDMVQTLRAKAMKEGNLKSDDHMKVSTKAAPAEGTTTTTTTTETTLAAEKPPQIIVIESADPEVIYVPTYSTSVYGYWGWGYPAYYWPPPYGYPGYGFWWGMGAGIVVGGIWGDCCWGGGDVDIDWDGGDINIDRGDRGNRVEHHGDRAGDRASDRGARTGDRATATDRGRTGQGGEKWSHKPEHRKGVSYRDNATASKFDRGSAGAGSREAFRGRTGSGSGSLGSGSRPSAGTRPSAGSGSLGSGSRPSAGTTGRGSGSRPSSGSSTWGGSRGSGAFGGMSSGSRAGSYGSRGGMSRGGGGRGGGGRRR